MKILKYVLVLVCWGSFSQVSLSSEEALQLQKEWIDSANQYKFSPNLDKYIVYSYRALELMSQIKGRHQHKLMFYSLFALRLNQLGLIKESSRQCKLFFDYYNTHENFLNNAEKEGLFENVAFNHSLLAGNYSKLGILDSAAQTYKQSIEYTRPGQSKYYVSALNNYGLFLYEFKKETDSALYYFKEAKKIADKSFVDKHIYGSIIDNIADIYLETGSVGEARALYKQNFAFYKVVPYDDHDFLPYDYLRLMSAGTQLVETQLLLNDFENAEKTLKEMEAYYKMPLEPETKLQYLVAKEMLFSRKKKDEAAYKALRELKAMQDKMAEVALASQNKLQNTLNEIAIDRIRTSLVLEKKQQEDLIKRQRLRYLIALLALTLIALFLLFLYQGRKQYLIIAKQKAKNATLQNKQLNFEIEAKKRDLSDFAINLTQSHEWAKDLYQQINALKETKGRARKKLFKELENDIKNKISFDRGAEEFYKKLDALSAAFYKKINENFPSLTKNEIRLCSLIRLKMNSQQISTLQNITISSLNTARYRLRKKLKLSESTDLDDFIQNL